MVGLPRHFEMMAVQGSNRRFKEFISKVETICVKSSLSKKEASFFHALGTRSVSS
jgi:hypothetical protein